MHVKVSGCHNAHNVLYCVYYVLRDGKLEKTKFGVGGGELLIWSIKNLGTWPFLVHPTYHQVEFLLSVFYIVTIRGSLRILGRYPCFVP